MPVIDRTPDFLVYMLSACALRAKAAVAANSVVARTIVECAECVAGVVKVGRGGAAAAGLMNCVSHN
jgi:hypothetical protein